MSGWHPTSPHDLLSVKYSGGKNLLSTAWTDAGKNLPFGPSPSPSGSSGAIAGLWIRPSSYDIWEAPHMRTKAGRRITAIAAAAGRANGEDAGSRNFIASQSAPNIIATTAPIPCAFSTGSIGRKLP